MAETIGIIKKDGGYAVKRGLEVLVEVTKDEIEMGIRQGAYKSRRDFVDDVKQRILDGENLPKHMGLRVIG